MFQRFRQEVASALEEALAAEDWPVDDLGLEEPPEDVDAILASSVAFRLADEADQPPPAVAATLADAIDIQTIPLCGALTVAGPYLNFEPSDRYYEATYEAAQSKAYPDIESKEESIVVEHTSANPTGPVHVGRARNPIVGDAVANLLEVAGYDVERHYYVNDAGRQVAVFTWAYETFDEDDLEPPERDRSDYDLVRYYRKGNDFLETADPDRAERAEQKIAAIMQGLEDGEEETYERVWAVVDSVLDGMQASLERLPVTFDAFIKETKFLRDGSTDAIVEELKAHPASFRKDDAWQLNLDEYGFNDNDLVFLRGDGTSLYTTRDLAHHRWKLENYDRAVTVLGEDHKLQADQVETALELLGEDTDRLSTIHYSWVTLPEGDMSTRKGTGVDLDVLLDEAIERAEAEVRDRLDDRIREDDLDESDIERIANEVGIGAVRFDIVAKQATKGITFEWDRALDFEAQSAPYIQYVHARCCGILDRAGEQGMGPADVASMAVFKTPEERALLEAIAHFPADIEAAADALEPHQIATVLKRFAETFNGFYRSCRVLDEDIDPEIQRARLGLVVAARQCVATGLTILGVAPPESM